MATAIGNLVVNFDANTKSFNRKVSLMRNVTRGLAGVFKSFLRVMAPVGSGFAFVAVIRGGEEFNRKMRQSLAIMGEVSQAMRGKMKVAALEMAAATRFAARDAAAAFFFLASAGLSAEQAIVALPAVTRFAQAGMFDLSTATSLAADAQSSMGLKVKNAAKNLRNLIRVTDVLTKANTLANATTEEFSRALTNKAGPALKIMGKDIEEGVAVLAAFADQGVKSVDAGTALNIVMRDLTTKSIRFKAEFQAAGVAVFDTVGEMRHMADIIEDLEGLLGGMSDEMKKATLLQLGFADKSISFIQALLGTSDKIRRYDEALRKAGGTTREVSDKQLTDIQKGTAAFGASITKLGITITDTLSPALKMLLTDLASLVDAFADIDTALDISLLKKMAGWFGDSIDVVEFATRILGTTFREAVLDVGVEIQKLNVLNKKAFSAVLEGLNSAFTMTRGDGDIFGMKDSIKDGERLLLLMKRLAAEAEAASLLALTRPSLSQQRRLNEIAKETALIKEQLAARRLAAGGGKSPGSPTFGNIGPSVPLTEEQVKLMDKVKKDATEASHAFVQAKRALVELQMAGKLEDFEFVSGMKKAAEEFDKAIGGPKSRIRELRDELGLLNGTLSESGIAMRDLAENPARGIFNSVGKDIKEVGRLMDEVAKAKEIASGKEDDRMAGMAVQRAAETPIESAMRRVKEIERLFSIGALGERGEEVRRRAIQKEADDLRIEEEKDQFGPRNAAAVEQGTQEAFGAIMASINQRGNSTERDIAKTNKEIAKATRDTANTIETIANTDPEFTELKTP